VFTGIVEEIGTVRSVTDHDLVVEAATVLEDVRLGDSIALNGVCLTVTAFDDASFQVGISPETLRKTNLGDLGPGRGVNLERALRPDGRLGGHIVQGHVEGTATIASIAPDGDALLIWFETPPDLLRYIVPKGFVAIDGTSLTVIDVTETAFSITLIAYSQAHVTLTDRRPGERVNIETDILGRYVERLIGAAGARPAAPPGT
jgi:riboflavin synthase